MKKGKFPSIPNHLKSLYICIFLSMVVWLFTLCTTQKFFKNNPLTNHDVTTFHEGWVDDAGDAIAVPNQYDVACGENFRIHYTFPHKNLTLLKNTFHLAYLLLPYFLH